MHGSHIAHDSANGQQLSVVDDATVVWSSGTRWGGVAVELHRFQHGVQAFYVHEHTVVVHRAPAIMEFEVAGGHCRQVVDPGDISLFSAGAPRRIAIGATEQLVVTLTPEFVTQAAKRGAAPAFDERYAVSDPQIVQIATALEAEALAGYPSGRVYGESMGIALTAHLVAHYSRHRTSAAAHTGGMSPCALRRVLGYIDEHLAEDIRLHALAQVAGLSPHRFAHNFKRATGLPPHQFVIHRRVERAKPLLRDTEMSMATLTYTLGFAGPSRFAHLFRRETGLTPSRYRAQFR